MPKKKPAIKRRPSAQAQSSPLGTYANHIRTQWGLSEMSITFNQTHAVGNDWPITEVSKITLPTVAAKALVFDLMTNILAYEAIHGPANVNPQILPVMPTSPLLTPDAIAKLAILRAELFPGSTPRAVADDVAEVDDAVTKH